MSPVWQEWTFVMRAGRNNTVKRRLHLLRQMVQIWQKNLVKLNTTQVRNPMADKRQIWWSTRHWLKNTARIKMSTFKNRTRAANAVGKTSRRGPVTEILLIGYNKKETTITSTGAPPTGRGPSWLLEMRRRHKLNFGTLNEGGGLAEGPPACDRVVAACFGWGEGWGGAAALIGLCWSRPAPPPGGWPGFSPAALVPGGWLTWSCRRERGQKRSFFYARCDLTFVFVDIWSGPGSVGHINPWDLGNS